jgi:hypothetical protein
MTGAVVTPDEKPVTVVVSGDVTMDWNLAREPLGDGDEHATTRAAWQRGGAALLADLLQTIGSTLPAGTRPVQIRDVEAPSEPIPPGHDELNHSYALWTRTARSAGDKGPGRVWRSTAHLGVDRARSDRVVRAEWDRLAEDVLDADVVVLDDADLGFRDLSDPTVWQRAFADGRRPWVVLKQARPVAEGALWDQLVVTAADRLIVVLTVEDLRGREVQISRDLSWERTAQDLVWELVHKPRIGALSRIAHTVVSFGPAGAALVSAAPDETALPTCTLYYDPEIVEGSWRTDHPGQVMGGTDTLTAALVRQILVAPEAPDLDQGIQDGIGAMRRLLLDGYEEHGSGRMELGFPLTTVVEEMQAGRAPLQRTDVVDPASSPEYWTILAERGTGDLSSVASEITLDGAEKALAGVPLGRFGFLVTADRSEIEAFRSVAALIEEYVTQPQSKPLSIGVFGPPGAGKSFGVKEVARAVGQGLVDKPMEFNLAQLGTPEDLHDALHLVRDTGLGGKIPLVFWDEFDTTLGGRAYGWLRYFLAPMQDGTFRQGQVTHPIGRAIFVFAGGTSARMEDFAEAVHDEAGRLAKGPDFVSRLKGFVNILGPNPQGPADTFHVVRRAILLRSMLERNAGHLLHHGRLGIDPGVLRAFLETREFRHGARSMEAIIAMSRLTGRTAYERSSLPPEAQLDLHVDARDFVALVQRPELEGEYLDRLARAFHEVYCDGLRDRSDLTTAEAESLVPYDELADYKKEENLRTVRDIPAKLAAVGCVMVPGRADIAETVFTEDELRTMARLEHELWMRGLGPGWRAGETTDKEAKVHAAYRPWEQLPPEQRAKDEDLVRGLPGVLHKAGYTVVRVGLARES